MLAARCLPGIVGWSGTAASHSSSLNLNWSTVPVLVSLRSLGMRLKSLAPLTDRLDSLAFLTEDGAWFWRRGTATRRPRRGLCMVLIG